MCFNVHRSQFTVLHNLMLAEMYYVSAKENEHQVWEYKNATFFLQCFFQIFKIVPLELK